MELVDVPIGSFAYRESWAREGRTLLVKRETRNSFYYYEHGEFKTKLRTNSSGFDKRDFKIYEKGKEMATSTAVKQENIKVIVSNNKTNSNRCFESEDEALEYIGAMLEDAPRTKFIMFKPYQKVEPKKVDLKGLITKIKD